MVLNTISWDDIDDIVESDPEALVYGLDHMVFYHEQPYVAHAYTAKSTYSKAPTKKDYEANYELVLADLKNDGVILVKPIYERDSLGKLHTHTTMLVPYFSQNKPHFTRRGMHTYHKICNDIGGWRDYCSKSQQRTINNTSYMF